MYEWDPIFKYIYKQIDFWLFNCSILSLCIIYFDIEKSLEFILPKGFILSDLDFLQFI